jgi:hypothetical protein
MKIINTGVSAMRETPRFVAWKSGRRWTSWHLRCDDKTLCGLLPAYNLASRPFAFPVALDDYCRNCLLLFAQEDPAPHAVAQGDGDSGEAR